MKVYDEIETFVDDILQKVSPNVKLANVKNLFLYTGIFLTLVLLVNVMDLWLLKQIQTINRKLVLWFTIIGQVIRFRLVDLFGEWPSILSRQR